MHRLITFNGLAVVSDDGEVRGAATQHRRLALLAVLARAGARGVARTRLLQLFWPDEDDEERRRKALAQALYALRRDLGHEGVIEGTQQLRLDPTCLSTDVGEFTEHLRHGRHANAVALYTGPFLAAFRLAGAPAFERWVEEERRALERDYVRALDVLATECEQAGRLADAVQWRYKAAAVDALDSGNTLALMHALAAQGEVAAAIRQAAVHAALLRQELDLPPDAAVQALADTLRERPAASPGHLARADSREHVAPTESRPASARAEETTVERTADATVERTENTTVKRTADIARDGAEAPRVIPRSRRTRIAARASWIAAALLLVLGGRAAWRARAHPSASGDPRYHAPPSIAVGMITDFRDSARGPVRSLATLLATNLARSGAFEVISAARLGELLQHGHAGDSTEAAFIAAARRADAHELIDGALFDPADGPLRLDLRRVDVASGRVLGALTLRGSDFFALADSGAARLLEGFGLAHLAGSVREVTLSDEALGRLVADEHARPLSAR